MTPERARQIIRRSHQRQIDLLKVRMVLDRVESGTWEDDPAHPVKIRDNVLLDGHHRVLAVLMHGAEIPLAIEES